MKVLNLLARRFVAGETAAEAIAVGRKLAARGIRATFDLLGEHVHDAETARRAGAACQDLLRSIPADVERNVSIKLTAMGLDVSPDLALETSAAVVRTARECGGFVRIDMEGSRLTQPTLDVFHSLRREFDNVGVVLQAYLHRSERDVEEAIARRDRVRLCKGAYDEPKTIAWRDGDQVRASYLRLAHRLLETGQDVALATHDDRLIEDAMAFAREHGTPPARFEFQMLYGIRRRRWDEIVRSGHRMRIYVPFGTHWLPYTYRRLRERRENVLFVLRHVFRA